jgi:hypothetical protein
MSDTAPKTDKQRFEEIRKNLTELGSKESAFIRVEQLFYEAINISRNYGNDVSTNKLLSLFKELEADHYQATKAHFKKSSQREHVIKRFINQFKIVLAMGIKDFLNK